MRLIRILGHESKPHTFSSGIEPTLGTDSPTTVLWRISSIRDRLLRACNPRCAGRGPGSGRGQYDHRKMVCDNFHRLSNNFARSLTAVSLRHKSVHTVNQIHFINDDTRKHVRLIRTLIHDDDVENVAAVLESHNIDYLLFREDGDRDEQVLVEFPLPTQAVESIMEEVRDEIQSKESYTVVTSAESVFSEHIDEMEERFITGTEEDDSIATEEVRAKALDMTPSPQTYYSMTGLSALVATAGLLLDSAAVVVGSMVIAPLVGSSLTASVGTVLNDRVMIVEGFKTQLLGLLLAIFGATVFSFALKSAVFLPPAINIATTQQIAQRISPGLLSVVVGLCAGAAGAFGLATGVSVTLVGVMIAAALIPAAAAVGIGVAWGLPAVTLGALLLLLMNIIAIHVAAATVLWYLGYRPQEWTRDAHFTPSHQQIGAIATTIVLLGSVFVGTAAIVSTHIAFEQDANQVVGKVLDQQQYSELELIAVHSEFRVRSPVTNTEGQQVTVVLARPVEQDYPELARNIALQIIGQTGREVVVVVEYIDQSRYTPAR